MSGEKYEPVWVSDINFSDITIAQVKQRNLKVKENQLDRIEQKMDRILEVLESGKLSTSFELDFKNSAKVINDQLDQMLEVRKRNARNLR